MQQNELKKNHANYSPLTPTVFIEKAAKIFPDRYSIIHENKYFTWNETFTRCKQLANSLSKKLAHGNVVGFIASNTPELYEAHFGVPMAGMILNAINYRLDAKTIAYIIDHSDIKLILVQHDCSERVNFEECKYFENFKKMVKNPVKLFRQKI